MIPKVIHRVWVGGPLPEWQRPFRATWERPGWKIVDWDERRIGQMPRLVNQAVYDQAERIAPRHVGQLRSDVLRYEILFRYGGVYVDTDFECLKPIDPLVRGDCFAAWEEQDRWLANGLLGATAGHPFIGRLIDGLQDSVRRNRGARPAKMTGPQYLTALWREHGEAVGTIPQRLVFPYGHREIRDHKPGDQWPDEAFLVHHWHNRRRERGVPCGR